MPFRIETRKELLYGPRTSVVAVESAYYKNEKGEEVRPGSEDDELYKGTLLVKNKRAVKGPNGELKFTIVFNNEKLTLTQESGDSYRDNSGEEGRKHTQARKDYYWELSTIKGENGNKDNTYDQVQELMKEWDVENPKPDPGNLWVRTEADGNNKMFYDGSAYARRRQDAKNLADESYEAERKKKIEERGLRVPDAPGHENTLRDEVVKRNKEKNPPTSLLWAEDGDDEREADRDGRDRIINRILEMRKKDFPSILDETQQTTQRRRGIEEYLSDRVWKNLEAVQNYPKGRLGDVEKETIFRLLQGSLSDRKSPARTQEFMQDLFNVVQQSRVYGGPVPTLPDTPGQKPLRGDILRTATSPIQSYTYEELQQALNANKADLERAIAAGDRFGIEEREHLVKQFEKQIADFPEKEERKRVEEEQKSQRQQLEKKDRKERGLPEDKTKEEKGFYHTPPHMYAPFEEAPKEDPKEDPKEVSKEVPKKEDSLKRTDKTQKDPQGWIPGEVWEALHKGDTDSLNYKEAFRSQNAYWAKWQDGYDHAGRNGTGLVDGWVLQHIPYEIASKLQTQEGQQELLNKGVIEVDQRGRPIFSDSIKKMVEENKKILIKGQVDRVIEDFLMGGEFGQTNTPDINSPNIDMKSFGVANLEEMIVNLINSKYPEIKVDTLVGKLDPSEEEKGDLNQRKKDKRDVPWVEHNRPGWLQDVINAGDLDDKLEAGNLTKEEKDKVLEQSRELRERLREDDLKAEEVADAKKLEKSEKGEDSELIEKSRSDQVDRMRELREKGPTDKAFEDIDKIDEATGVNKEVLKGEFEEDNTGEATKEELDSIERYMTVLTKREMFEDKAENKEIMRLISNMPTSSILKEEIDELNSEPSFSALEDSEKQSFLVRLQKEKIEEYMAMNMAREDPDLMQFIKHKGRALAKRMPGTVEKTKDGDMDPSFIASMENNIFLWIKWQNDRRTGMSYEKFKKKFRTKAINDGLSRSDLEGNNFDEYLTMKRYMMIAAKRSVQKDYYRYTLNGRKYIPTDFSQVGTELKQDELRAMRDGDSNFVDPSGTLSEKGPDNKDLVSGEKILEGAYSTDVEDKNDASYKDILKAVRRDTTPRQEQLIKFLYDYDSPKHYENFVEKAQAKNDGVFTNWTALARGYNEAFKTENKNMEITSTGMKEQYGALSDRVLDLARKNTDWSDRRIPGRAKPEGAGETITPKTPKTPKTPNAEPSVVNKKTEIGNQKKRTPKEQKAWDRLKRGSIASRVRIARLRSKLL